MSDLSTTPTGGEVAAKQTTVAEAALALFAPLEAEVNTLAERYRNVAFDMSTPKGFKGAKDARLELRESGRFALQRLRDKTKDQLNDCKKVVDAEAARLIEIVRPVETAVDEQITVHENKLAAEKAERDRIEAERRQKHLDAIAKIESYVAKADGLPVERIEAGLAYVRDIDVSAAVFDDFAVRASAQKDATIRALEKMIADVRQAAAAEALRVENERLQAELAAMRSQQAAPAPAPAAAAGPAAAPVAEAPPTERTAEAPIASHQPATAAYGGSRRISSSAPAAVSAPAAAIDTGAAAANEPSVGAKPTLRIGEISERLGHPLTAQRLRDWGIEPATREGAATLYHEHQFALICDAVARNAMQAKAAHAQRLAA